jgi:DNA processing protein
MNEDAFLHRIAITLIEGVGDVIARQLISYCGSVEAVFQEKKKSLLKIPDIGPKTAQAIVSFKDFGRAEKELAFAKKHGIKIHFFTDPSYPSRLRNCHDAPLLLYSKGENDLNIQRVVGIVGTRRATESGKTITESLCMELGAMGATIVSGLAFGIDITAHRTCLENDIPTWGVVAHGLDRIYPKEHTSIARKMTGLGNIITENPSGTAPDRENFPRRNRIIAGMCDAIIVTEAAKTGGALITADIANSYNRDVFAVPGRLNDPMSEGCNMLIKTHRASLLQSAADVRYILGWQDEKTKIPKQTKLFLELDEKERQLMHLLESRRTLFIDDIASELQSNPGETCTLLIKLELKGLVKNLPGKRYSLI